MLQRGGGMAEELKNGIYVSFDGREAGWDMPTFHYHDFYEIYYLCSGTRRYVVDNTIYDMKAGDIIIIDKNELHITKNIMKNSGYQRYLLYFTEDALCTLGDNSSLFMRVFTNRVISLGKEKLKRIDYIFQGLLKSYNTADAFSAQLLANGTYELCTMIYDAVKNDENEARKFFSNNIDKALVYLNENFRENVSLDTVSKICNMNKSYFSRCFRKITGIGFSKYLTALRIKEAGRLLANTDMPIGEIAEKSGFESQQHFCYIFKKETGRRAGEYRFQKRNLL